MSAKPNRRTQEQRTADTRALLAQSAFELIRDQGYANFRVAGVAKHAGVSQGGQLHHFPTKDSMTMAAIEYAIGQAQERTEGNLADFRPQHDIVNAIINDSRDYYFSPSFDVAMDITKSASGNTELQKKIANAHRHYRAFAEESWFELLCNRGWQGQDARDLIDMTTSLVRGFAIRALIHPDQKAFARLFEKWRAMVTASFPPTD